MRGMAKVGILKSQTPNLQKIKLEIIYWQFVAKLVKIDSVQTLAR